MVGLAAGSSPRSTISSGAATSSSTGISSRACASCCETRPRRSRILSEALFTVSPRKTVCPKTVTQREYLHAMRELDLTLGIGRPDGKTYLAVAVGVSLFLQKRSSAWS